MRLLLAVTLLLLFLCEFMFLEKCYYTDTVQQFCLAFPVRQLQDTLISAGLLSPFLIGLYTAQTPSDTLDGHPCAVSL